MVGLFCSYGHHYGNTMIWGFSCAKRIRPCPPNHGARSLGSRGGAMRDRRWRVPCRFLPYCRRSNLAKTAVRAEPLRQRGVGRWPGSPLATTVFMAERLRTLWHYHGLSLVLIVLFAGSMIGQTWTGWYAYNAD